MENRNGRDIRGHSPELRVCAAAFLSDAGNFFLASRDSLIELLGDEEACPERLLLEYVCFIAGPLGGISLSRNNA
jgi:hypothetical protein